MSHIPKLFLSFIHWYIIRWLLATVAVALILSIMYVILFPPHMDVSRRSRVSRVKADQRSLATAIEAYYVDHNTYPAMRAFTTMNVDMNELKRMGGINFSYLEPGSKNGPYGLT